MAILSRFAVAYPSTRRPLVMLENGDERLFGDFFVRVKNLFAFRHMGLDGPIFSVVELAWLIDGR